jgi:hypothetical protein
MMVTRCDNDYGDNVDSDDDYEAKWASLANRLL